VLDFSKITKTERERAERLANSAAGAALEADIQGEEVDGGAKTFVPGEGKTAEESFMTSFTPEEKEHIRQMVANAKSPAEIEEIERSVRRGILPKLAADDENNGKKRPAAENGNGEATKKSRVEAVEGGE
jgi:hydrogenase maturation factor HypE